MRGTWLFQHPCNKIHVVSRWCVWHCTSKVDIQAPIWKCLLFKHKGLGFGNTAFECPQFHVQNGQVIVHSDSNHVHGTQKYQ